MPELNVSCPEFECWIHKEFLYDQEEHQGEFERAVVFGLSSVEGRALGFHAITEVGAVIWRLPIHALVHRTDAPKESLENLELWDAFSCHVSVTEFDFLSEQKVKVWLRDGKTYDGEYMFTIDWWNSPSADSAGDIGHKCAHIIELNNGCYAAQPNNRIQFFEQAFVTKPFKDRPGFKTNTHIFKCENGSKWLTDDSDRMFYDVRSKNLRNMQTKSGDIKLPKEQSKERRLSRKV